MSKKNFEGKVRDEIIDELMSNAADFYRGKEKELGKKFLDSDQLAGIEYIFKKNIIRMDIWNLVKYFGRFCADVVSGDIKNVDEHRLELLNSLGASKKDIGGNKYPEATATFVSTKFHNVIQNEYGEIVKCFDDNKKEISEDFMKIVKIAFNNEPVDIELINEIKKTRMGFVELKSLRLNDCDVDNESINTLMFHLSSLDFLIEELRLGYKNTILEETGRDFYSVNELLNSNVSIGEIIDSLKKFDILKDENICSKDDVVEYFREKNELDLLEIQTAEMSESEEDSQVWMKTFDFEGDVCFVPIKDKVCFSAGLKGLNISKETLLPALDFGEAKNVGLESGRPYNDDFDELCFDEKIFTNLKKKNNSVVSGSDELGRIYNNIDNVIFSKKDQSIEEEELFVDGKIELFKTLCDTPIGHKSELDEIMSNYRVKFMREELMVEAIKLAYKEGFFQPDVSELKELNSLFSELEKDEDKAIISLKKNIVIRKISNSSLFEKAVKENLKSMIQGKDYVKREDLIDEMAELSLFFKSKWISIAKEIIKETRDVEELMDLRDHINNVLPDSFLYNEISKKSEEELKEVRAKLDNLINMYPSSERQEHKPTRIDFPNNGVTLVSPREHYTNSSIKNKFKEKHYEVVLKFNTRIVHLMSSLFYDGDEERALRRFDMMIRTSSDIKFKNLNNLKLIVDSININAIDYINESTKDLDALLETYEDIFSNMEKRLLNNIRNNLDLFNEDEFYEATNDSKNNKPEGLTNEWLDLYGNDYVLLDYLSGITDEERNQYIENQIAKPMIEFNFIDKTEKEVVNAVHLLLDGKINTSSGRSKNMEIVGEVIRYLHLIYSEYGHKDLPSGIKNAMESGDTKQKVALVERLDKNSHFLSTDHTKKLGIAICLTYAQGRINLPEYVSKTMTVFNETLKLSKDKTYQNFVEQLKEKDREKDKELPDSYNVDQFLVEMVMGVPYFAGKISREEQATIKQELVRILVSHIESHRQEEKERKQQESYV
jgi:hypothetical protein